MEKRALLVYGIPNKDEDSFNFKEGSKKNIELMTKVANNSGYKTDISHLYNFDLGLKDYHNVDQFLFYFTGHSNQSSLGHHKNSLDNFLDSIAKIKGEKIVILDSCTEEFIPQKKLPRQTKIFGAHKSYDYRSLAKLFYELTEYYNKDLREIDKKSFDEIKQNWVYVGG